MVKNEAGEFYDLNLTICFLTSEKHSFGVHTDKSPKICTQVEQIFLYKAGLLLNIDVAVKSKNVATVFPFSVHLIARMCRRLTAHNIPLELLSTSG